MDRRRLIHVLAVEPDLLPSSIVRVRGHSKVDLHTVNDPESRRGIARWTVDQAAERTGSSPAITQPAYGAAVVGVLRVDPQLECAIIEMSAGSAAVYSQETSFLDLPSWNEVEVVVRGGPVADGAQPPCGAVHTWIATDIEPFDPTMLERPRIHPEPFWDPFYQPLRVEHGNIAVTFDRWHWAILDDIGFATVQIDGVVVVEGPVEWVVSQSGTTQEYSLNDPHRGEQVGFIPSFVFTNAVGAAGVERGLWAEDGTVLIER